MFIATPEPPPLRTKLFVTIKLPEGQVRLESEVVHVVDAEAATLRRIRSGVGVQFTHLSAEARRAVNAFVDGLAANLAVEAVDVASTTVGSGRPSDTTQRFLDAMRREDIYGALGVSPLATSVEVHERIAELASTFKATGSATAVQKARLETSSRMLERVRNLMREPESRIDFDFRHDLLFIEERVRQAPNPAALALLRKVWRTRFSETVELADGCWLLAMRSHAAGDLASAIRNGFDALESDPFNLEAREKIATWVARAQGKGPRLKSPTLPSFVHLPRD